MYNSNEQFACSQNGYLVAVEQIQLLKNTRICYTCTSTVNKTQVCMYYAVTSIVTK